MVLLGWMSDMHVRPSESDTPSGATTEFQTDYNKLVTTYGTEDVYFTGDQVHPASQGEPPHVPKAAYDRFWSLVDGTDDSGDSVRSAIPGNHDIPIQGHLEADERAVLRARVDYPDDNVTVLMVNTQANSFVTGGRVDGDNNATGAAVPRMPYSDIRWMDEQLDDAGSNAKIILPHAVMYPTANSAFPEVGYTSGGRVYHLIENWRAAHRVLSGYNKVVVPQSHIYSFGSGMEDSTTVDGVEYVRTQHYHRGSDDSVHTFGRIDVSGSSVTVTTEEHSDGTEYTNLDKTF